MHNSYLGWWLFINYQYQANTDDGGFYNEAFEWAEENEIAA